MEINARTISDAWDDVLRCVITQGTNQKVQTDGKLRDTVEFSGVIITNIEMPYIDMVPKKSKFAGQSLKTYSDQLWLGSNPTGFVYTYGNRLRKGHNRDQLALIVSNLREDPTSRREVAITWKPDVDLVSEEVPCMILCQFVVRNDHLNVTAYFRSHDVYGAWPSNAYALAMLMVKVSARLLTGIGRLTIISNCAHVYNTDLSDASMVMGVKP